VLRHTVRVEKGTEGFREGVKSVELPSLGKDLGERVVTEKPYHGLKQVRGIFTRVSLYSQHYQAQGSLLSPRKSPEEVEGESAREKREKESTVGEGGRFLSLQGLRKKNFQR